MHAVAQNIGYYTSGEIELMKYVQKLELKFMINMGGDKKKAKLVTQSHSRRLLLLLFLSVN